MGIGISFTGHDGRTQSANAESLGDAKSLLGEMMASSKDVLSMLRRGGSTTIINNIEEGRRRRKKDKVNPGAAAGVKIDPMGSIEDSPFGIRLMGDRQVGAVPRSLMYGYSATGMKGYWGLAAIDPPVKGQLIGPVASDSEEEDKSEHKENDPGAFTFAAVSRIVAKQCENPLLDFKTLYLFLREVSVTANGRTIAVSGERRINLGMFSAQGENGGSKAPPGNFEPKFDDNGAIYDVGEGYWPFGRRFSNAVTVDSSAKIADGFIYLEITHPVPSSSGGSTPSAVIKGVPRSAGYIPDFSNGDPTKSLIPLYRVYQRAIFVDFRSCMSLTMREN